MGMQQIVQKFPRGASLEDANGCLPLHLAIESGKSWEGGVQIIHNAYQRAIEIREYDNGRMLPVHCALACPHTSLDLIKKIWDLYPQAARELDGYARTALHLAVESGKDWDS